MVIAAGVKVSNKSGLISWSVVTLMAAPTDPNTDPSMQLQVIALERDLRFYTPHGARGAGIKVDPLHILIDKMSFCLHFWVIFKN